MGYIYLTTNLVNGKKYIGQRRRKSEGDNWYLGSGTYLKHAIQKYGRENFKKEILIEGSFTNEKLNCLEKEYIEKHDAVNSTQYYNLAEGGRHKVSDFSPIHKYAIITYVFDENKKFLCKCSSVREASLKYGLDGSKIKRLMELGRKSRKLNLYFSFTRKLKIKPHTEKRGKCCYLYDRNWNLVRKFNSLTQCAKYLNVDLSTVQKVCKEFRTIKGYYPRYEKAQMFIRKNLHKKPLVLFNDDVYLEFNSLLEASNFLKEKYGLKGNISSTLLRNIKRREIFKDYKIKTEVNGSEIICDKVNKLSRSKVEEYSENQLVKVWKSSEEAAKFYNICGSAIRHCAQGKLRTYKQRIWKYEKAKKFG